MLFASITIVGLLIGLVAAALVAWVLNWIGAPAPLAVLVALIVLIICVTQGVDLH